MNKRFHSAFSVSIMLLIMFLSVSCAGTGLSSSSERFMELEKEAAEVAELITDYKQLKQYFLAIGYGDTEPSHDFRFMYMNKEWHVNKSAVATFFDNTGDCGAGSNLFCYMLNGDYRELGYIFRRDTSGSHIINYFQDNDGLWHIVDVTGFVGGNDYANHLTGTTLQDVADKYVARVKDFCEKNKIDFYVRSLYAIKSENGENHPPENLISLQEGKQPEYYAKSVRDKLVKLYVRDNDKRNFVDFVNYNIPTSLYPYGIGYGNYTTNKSMEKLRDFASKAKEIAASLIKEEPVHTHNTPLAVTVEPIIQPKPDNEQNISSDIISLRMYNDDIVYPDKNFGFGTVRKELKVQLNGEIIKDYEFTVENNIGTITKTEAGTLIFEASKTGFAYITITVGDCSATFRWRN